jgi:hypothetical protein
LQGFHADYRRQLESYLPTLAEGSAERIRYLAEMDLLRQDRRLAELERTRFVRLIPGHGEPMDRAAFRTYRKAFDRLLTCAAGVDGKDSCIDGWFADAKSIVSPGDVAYGRVLLAYYFDQFIKPDAPGRKRWRTMSD